MTKKQTVLIVIGSFKIGGAERMSINVGEELRRNGFVVHYALQRPIVEIPQTIGSEFIHLLNENTDKPKLLMHLNSIVQIFLLRLKLKPFCVVAFTYYSSFIACFSLSKNVIGRFDINPYILNRKLRHRIANLVSKWPFVRKIIVPSYGIGGRLRQINSQFKNKIDVIPNSIDFEKVIELSLKEKNFNFDFRSKYITAMGRFTHQKNYGLLLNAYQQSRIKSEYDLVIVGDGVLRKNLEELSKQLGIEKNVHFVGFLTNPFPVIKRSQLFINTSNFESFCNVILEALSLGVPVIATDCDYGPSEMIQHNVNGLLVPVNDETQLISTLDMIAKNEQVVSDFRKTAQKSVEKFKLRAIGQSWFKLLSSYR